jgi:hypothetical protein
MRIACVNTNQWEKEINVTCLPCGRKQQEFFGVSATALKKASE